MEIHKGARRCVARGVKRMTPASRYKKKHPVDVKVHKSPENAHGVQEMAKVRAEDEEYDVSSGDDDGLCRCPVWWGKAPEVGFRYPPGPGGVLSCPDCLGIMPDSKPQHFRIASDAGDTETASQECDPRPGDTKHQPDFPDVPKLIWGGCWSRVIFKMWAVSEPQCILEARAAIFTLKRLCRCIGNVSQHHLILGDAMVVVLTLTKGRSSSPVLLSICRQWCA